MVPFNKLKNKLNLHDQITFGIHAGKTIGLVCEEHPDYLDWCITNGSLKVEDTVISALKTARNTQVLRRKARAIKSSVEMEYAYNAVPLNIKFDDIPF